MSDEGFEQVSFLDERPAQGARVTVEFADPDVPKTVFDFDELHIEQSREVHKKTDGAGNVVELVPDKLTVTVLTGKKTD